MDFEKIVFPPHGTIRGVILALQEAGRVPAGSGLLSVFMAVAIFMLEFIMVCSVARCLSGSLDTWASP